MKEHECFEIQMTDLFQHQQTEQLYPSEVSETFK